MDNKILIRLDKVIKGEVVMKISTKGRYALRLMLDIALNQGPEPVSVKDIAVRQGISDKYLEQIISKLNRANYVKSVRGPQGGYILTKPLEEYTVGMILRLTEGSLVPVACLEREEEQCEKQEGCPTRRLWSLVDDAVNSVIDKVTLADLVSWQNEVDDN